MSHSANSCGSISMAYAYVQNEADAVDILQQAEQCCF